jgi:hypothetical protein
MRNLCFIVALFFLATSVKSQELQPVFKGKIEAGSAMYELLPYAFHKGDVMVLDIKTEKRKLGEVHVADQDGKILMKKEGIEKLSNQEITIPETGVYEVRIKGRGLASRTTSVSISRKKGGNSPDLFNPAFVMETFYDTTEVAYKCDTVVGNLPDQFEEVELEVFDKYIYQNKNLVDESFQLKGNIASDYTRHFNYKVPEPPEGQKLKSYSYTMTSKAGGAKHWDLAKIGTSVGGMFVNPAAGYAMNHMMGMMGPQAGGEPTVFAFSKEESDAAVIKKMTDGKGAIKDGVSGFINDVTGGAAGEEKKNYSADLKALYQFSKSTTHYGQHLNFMEEGTMILSNADPHKAKNVNLNMSCIFYGPLYRKVKAEEKIVLPEIKELDKLEKKITQKRYFELLDSSTK